MQRPAPTDHPIDEILCRRWSPRAFAPVVVERAKLLQLFEAAGWAPSSNNEQPWRYTIVTGNDPELLDAARTVLNPSNAWATKVPIPACVVARTVSRTLDRRFNQGHGSREHQGQGGSAQ